MDVIKPPDYLIQKTDASSSEGLWKKTIEKLIIYSYFWAISTSIPQVSFGRFERMLWD